jgi:pyruvate/2-oxoglutarate/acetoin dehydrogenase E1 component
MNEIVRTCSNENVAKAAVASLGCTFAERVRASAGVYGLSVGAFTAWTVRRFHDSASDCERKAVGAAMAGSDQPILVGLRRILELALAEDDSEGCAVASRIARFRPVSGAVADVGELLGCQVC